MNGQCSCTNQLERCRLRLTALGIRSSNPFLANQMGSEFTDGPQCDDNQVDLGRRSLDAVQPGKQSSDLGQIIL